MNEIEVYISAFPEEVQQHLTTIREIILNSNSEILESISYGMPAYKLKKKPLVYFAAYPNHIGFYATPNGHEAFQKEFSVYKQGKGSVQFPLDKPIPFDLIKRVVEFRIESILNASKK
ncbi:DUF1801 domain-containing protein [bacterium]|nr:MAG: DUF1801 domain-containing protein [bacterium]